MDERVIEYFNSYFGGELNESTSQNDLLEAAIQLIELRNLVLDEAHAPRAARAHGARQTITNTLKDKEARRDIANTKEGQRLIKHHEEPVAKKPEDIADVPFWKPSFGVKPNLNNPSSTTYTRPQKTKQLTKKAIEAGPQPTQRMVGTPKERKILTGSEKGKTYQGMKWTKQGEPAPPETQASHSVRVSDSHAQGISDMEARLKRLRKTGAERRASKADIDIHDSYNPKNEETAREFERRKKKSAEHDYTGPGLAGKSIEDATRMSIANQLGADSGISLDDLKKASATVRRKAAEEAKKRHGRYELRDRGDVARKSRERKGQGNLF